jgi:hypothetical protein
MHERDDFVFGEPLGPRVSEVSPTDDFKLLITFNNGEKRVFDANPLLNIPVFKPLSDKNFFENVKTEFGTVIWENDIDYCPDTLYTESIPINIIQGEQP